MPVLKAIICIMLLFFTEPPNTPLSQSQAKIVNDLASSVKQSVFQLSTGNKY